MVSGWHVGCRPEGSRPTSYIQRVWRSRVSSDEQRPIDWILLCLSVPSSVGCVARRNTAPWSPLHEEDAKRPHREREQLVGKRTGIVNRMKAALVRLGIRGFNPKLRKAAQKLAALRTPEGGPIPPNTMAELLREMTHLRFIDEQIKQIEDARVENLKQAPQQGLNAKVLQPER